MKGWGSRWSDAWTTLDPTLAPIPLVRGVGVGASHMTMQDRRYPARSDLCVVNRGPRHPHLEPGGRHGTSGVFEAPRAYQRFDPPFPRRLPPNGDKR